MRDNLSGRSYSAKTGRGIILKKKEAINLILLVALIAAAGLSFAPCIREISENVISVDGIPAGSISYEDYPFVPFFFCIVTGIEILLLLLKGTAVSRIMGLTLHLLKAFASLWLILNGWFVPMGGLYTYRYMLTAPGYLLEVVCIAALILYVFDLVKIFRKPKN